MKIIDGKDAIMGRLASYAAKELIKGEEIVVVNCNEVLISGSRKNLEKEFQEKRGRYGSSQKGPKIHRSSEKIVKRTIRGMLPNHREGRGREIWKKLRCYNSVPKEFVSEQVQDSSLKNQEREGKKFIEIAKEKKVKSIKVRNLLK